MRSGNPFIEQIPGDLFVGREEELRQVQTALDGLAAGAPGHTYVAGLHGTGKTALLNKIVELARTSGFIALRMTLSDASESGKQTDLLGPEAVMKIAGGIVEEVERRLRSSGQTDALLVDWQQGTASQLFRTPRAGGSDSDALLADLATLSGHVEKTGARGIVVCIDEGQRLAPSALSTLKNALQQHSGVLVFIALRLATAEVGSKKAGRVLLDELAERAEGDIGASRLFTSGIGMGPFANDDEALRCIAQRLKRSHIDFAPAVSREIVKLARRVPRDIIFYGNKVWQAASYRASGEAEARFFADEALLEAAFREEHPAELEEAETVVASLSNLKLTVLRALVTTQGSASAADIARRLSQNEVDLDMHTRAVSAEFEDMARDLRALDQLDDVFVVSSPVDLFALKLALGSE
jgi:AAA ATPase domain